MSDSAVLTLNAGSSSLKFAIFTNVVRPRRLWSGAIERIGLPGARFRLSDARGAVFREETGTIADHDTALKRLLLAIEHEASGVKLVAVGHRIAHGGPDCDCPEHVTPTLRARLQQLTALAPMHLPANIAGIDAVRIAGKNNRAIEGILGDRGRTAMIHRDDLVLQAATRSVGKGVGVC